MAGLRTPIKDDNKVACHSERDSHPESCPELVSGSFQDPSLRKRCLNKSSVAIAHNFILGSLH